jgi:hypothetical protein
VLQWHEEELHDTAGLAFGPVLLENKCKSRFKVPNELQRGPDRLLSDRRPRFGLPAAGRLPSQKGESKGPGAGPDQPDPPTEEIPTTGPPADRKLPHWPPRLPAPAKFNYVLPTVLEGGVLNVTITKPFPHCRRPPFERSPEPEFRWAMDCMEDPLGTLEEHGQAKPPLHPIFKSSVTVNGQQTRLEVVARNGAVHSIGRLLNPFKCKGPHHEPPTNPKEGEDDEWVDWEEWLPAWAEV